uniref:NADH-ubiquinone oxidoreductase chain 4 n=1 Tax=Hylarana albolabris TaxID=333676 RepID=S4V272_HYLAO|nr:NADH dehydrogenase subunit 4 [Amnirana albolabris]
MMTVMSAWFALFFTSLITPRKHLWALISGQGFLIATVSIIMAHAQSYNFVGTLFFIDELSGPFAILACWLFPLTILASQGKISIEPFIHQRSYIITNIFLQFITLLAFTTSDLLMFFFLFEASLLPTMFIIVRWGVQEQRLQAGLYLAFYTLVGAVPMMTWLIYFYVSNGSLSASLAFNAFLTQAATNHPAMFWLALNFAFLIKLPLFCLHLWLPKAHVEAPIAGSMILAGTLLKLGGYGILRTALLFLDNTVQQALFIMFVAIMGILTSAVLCLRQSDMKALIAMSSVSHMNLVVVAAMISTPASYSGAILLMIAHGLTSSLIFSLANVSYERIHSRSILFLRGSLAIYPLAGAWWLMGILYNMAIPPTVNFISEVLAMIALHNWSVITFLIVAANLVFTTAYTLYLLWSTQRGYPPSHTKTLNPIEDREHLLLFLHLLMVVLITIYLQLFCN